MKNYSTYSKPIPGLFQRGFGFLTSALSIPWIRSDPIVVFIHSHLLC